MAVSITIVEDGRNCSVVSMEEGRGLEDTFPHHTYNKEGKQVKNTFETWSRIARHSQGETQEPNPVKMLSMSDGKDTEVGGQVVLRTSMSRLWRRRCGCSTRNSSGLSTFPPFHFSAWEEPEAGRQPPEGPVPQQLGPKGLRTCGPEARLDAHAGHYVTS